MNLMPLWRPRTFLAFTGAVCALVLPAFAQQVISFPDFSSTTGLNCNGNASVSGACRNAGNVLTLTDANGSEAGSAWFSNPSNQAGSISLANGFTTNFQFRFTNGSTPPADGLAFVIQNTSLTALADPGGSTGGGSLGYGTIDGGADPAGFPSVAIEFDTFLNSENADPYVPHVAIQSCGGSTDNTANHASCNYGISASGAVPYLSDGNVHTATINYVVTSTPTLSVFIDGTLVLSGNINIPAVLGLDASGDAYVGFTAATGADFEEHDLLNWNLSTTSPPAPVTSNTPAVITTFNNAPNNGVTHAVDFSLAFSSGTVSGTDNNPALASSNEAVAPGDWSQFVAGTPFATTTCVPHNGEGGNCKLFVDLCTNDVSSTPSGLNCPQSSQRNILIQDSFDATPKPGTPLGTGFGLLMGGDDWSTQGASSCVFLGSEAGNPCPQNILTSFSGDGSIGSGVTKGLNSTFVTVAGVLMPTTAVTISPTNSYGWTNSTNPSVSFTSSPPGTAGGISIPAVPPTTNSNNFVAAPIAGVTYSLNGPNNPSLIAAGPCPASIVPGTTVANPFTGGASLTNLSQGLNTLFYSASDCAGTEELVFTFTGIPSSGSWSTSTKSSPIYVDSMAPTASCPPADTVWHNANVTVNCSANDTGAGFAPPTSAVNGTSFGSLSENIPLSTTVLGQMEIANAMTGSTTVSDLAGNGPVAVGPVGPFKIDTKAPVITEVTPLQNSIQNYFLNQTAKITATYHCSDGGSGVAVCGTATYSTPVQGTTANISNNLNTALLGQSQSFVISANDAVGNSATANLFTYNVSYAFLGFLTLQQPPLTNPLKAGKATAILFDVQDGKPRPITGLKLAPAGAVTVAAFSSTNCSGVNPTTVAFNGTLSGLPLGAYSLNWTPPSTLAGKCVTLTVNLGDGVGHKVNLKF